MRAPAAFIAGFVLLSGCGPDVAADGGRDAGRDGGRDAATTGDAGRDAGRDSGRDAGEDAARPDPEWVFVQGLPPTCHIEVARDPESVFPPLRFEPCPDRPGCRRVVVDWPGEGENWVRLGLYEDSAADETHSYFTWSRPLEVRGVWYRYRTVASDEGVPVFVLRTPAERDEERPCTMSPFAITPSSFATAVVVLDLVVSDHRSYPLRARFDAPVDSWANVTTRPEIMDAIQEVDTSDTTTVLDSAGRTYRYGLDERIEQLETGDAIGVNDVFEDDILASVFINPDGWRGVRYAPGSTTPETLVPAASEGEAAMLHRDGAEMCWFRLINPITLTRYEQRELWISEMDGSAVRSSRLISNMPLPVLQASVGHRFGRVWVGAAEDVFGIVDTESGERREYRSPPDRTLGGFPILGPEEVGVGVDLGPFRGLETIEFVRYDALPVVPVSP